MIKKLRYLLPVVFFVGLAIVLVLLARGKTFELLDPAGIIAEKQKRLIVFAATLSLAVVIPVYALLVFILMRYRATNKKAKYSPNWDGDRRLETVWWGIPIMLILILSVVTWVSTHDLDPFKPLSSDKKPLKVQVVALEWKWLFIYPEQGIATVNYLQIPKNTPVEFQITADAPMNSFWVPQLGGQIYAMSGMSTELNLKAENTGTFLGRSANLSGEGFAGMQFRTESTDEPQFDAWITSVKESSKQLDRESYAALKEQSENDPAMYFGSTQNGLYESIVASYTLSGRETAEAHHRGGHY